MKHLIVCLLVAIVGCDSAVSGAGGTTPAAASRPAVETQASTPVAKEVVAIMHRVNDWQVGHPSMKPNDRNWERGTWYTGVMAAYKATGDEKFLTQAVNWGKQHQWQVGTEKQGANRLFCVETWAEVYFVKKDRAMIEPAIMWLDTEANNSPAGAKVWYLEGGRRYADSLYGACSLAMLARATGNNKYLDYMHAFFWDVQAELFDKDDGLFYRDKRFIGQKTKNGKKVFWSRGNGWVIGGIVRILEYLPENDPQRARYIELFKTLAASIAKCQGSDGLWRPNLGDADEFAVPETSGTGFFCYAMAWGINHGFLDRDTYLPVVCKAWDGLVKSVSAEGKVQWGQPVGDRPRPVQEELTHEYVTGTFLLAGSEMFKLAKKAPRSNGSPMIGEVERHPLGTQIRKVLENQKTVTHFSPTGLGRADYLKIVNGQILALQKYQKPDGDIPDPVDGRTQFGPACYAHSVAVLAASGFNADPKLLESGMLSMDFCVKNLAKGVAAFRDRHPDFYTYPVMLAYEQFQKVAPRERLAAWREQLAAINPAKAYVTYGGTGNNWTLVHTGGEYLRSLQGMTDLAYVDRVLKIQQSHMTPLGMYLEHGAPFAYDAFSRYFLTGMLRRGCQDEFYRDACWKGAWTSLMIQSPFGELPTGYRSAQHIWNEAELAKVYEIYAGEYARAGQRAEAGAFKRGARLAMASVGQWIRPDGSGYIVKNRYPMSARHGYESYSVYGNYNLLACSMLCSAWQYADDSIEEMPSPADVGGFAIQIPDFNTVVASAGGSYVQYMTRGNDKYNPNGLVRVHLRGGHPQLGYSDGILHKAPALTCKVEVLEESLMQVRFRAGKDTITLNAEGVRVAVESADHLSFPMLVNDGRSETKVKFDGRTIGLELDGRGVQVALIEPASAAWQRTGKQVSHRNGLVEEAFVEAGGQTVVYQISALPAKL